MCLCQQSNTNVASPKSRGGKEGGGKKDKKKSQQTKDKKTVSLQDFQAEGSAGGINWFITCKIFSYSCTFMLNLLLTFSVQKKHSCSRLSFHKEL